MAHGDLHVVTGAFGFSGRYIAARLLDAGMRVRTLTNSPRRQNPFGARVEVHPYHFDAPEELAASLRGAAVLYNTYWVRFDARGFSHAKAVENTLTLFRAAQLAGVERVVHVSITNPAEDSPLPYFRGKARLERALRESGLSYAILRPALLFGPEDILINNIAWTLRRLPVFGVFGDGNYRLQPIYVDDLAGLAVELGRHRDNMTVDAIGPETFTYRELVQVIARAIGVRRPVVAMPPGLAYLAGSLIGRWMGDVMITRDEIAGLMAGLLCTASQPLGETRLSTWAHEHSAALGRRYASELKRRRDRERSYGEL